MNFELKVREPGPGGEWDVDALLVLCADEVLAASRYAGPGQRLGAVRDCRRRPEPGPPLVAVPTPCRAWRRAAGHLRDAGWLGGTDAQEPLSRRWARSKGCKTARLGVYAGSLGVAAVNLMVQAVADELCLYRDQVEGRGPKHPPCRCRRPTRAVRSGFELGWATVRGVELAREWANKPANHATPTLLAEAAQQLGKIAPELREVLARKEVEALGMGAFMAVAQGSRSRCASSCLKYQGAGPSVAPVVLVGKGITFDTGGISITAGGRDGRDEVRHGRRGQRAGHLRRAGRVQAGAQRGRPDPGLARTCPAAVRSSRAMWSRA